MSKRKPYIPRKVISQEALNERYRRLLDTYETSLRVWDMEKEGVKNHFSKITNFTSHDLKNSIQNMDAIISTLETDNLTQEQVETIKSCLNSMRISLDNFYKLSFEGRKIDFTLTELANLVELLNKASFNDFKIKFFSKVENTEIIFQPFHSILQVLNNLMINSLAAFKDNNEDKKVYVNYTCDSQNVVIEVLDNASKIPEELKEKIFEIYYSTTGGSGIGLAHAKHILDSLKGSIQLGNCDEEYCTKFVIKFPIKNNND